MCAMHDALSPCAQVSSMDHQLASRIQQITQELRVHDNELTIIKDLLDRSRKEKAFARSKHVHDKNNLMTVHNKTKRFMHERREVRQQLKLKEKELQYLQFLQKQQEKNEDLRAIIEAKEAEIMLLRESLDGLMLKLESSQEEAKSLREQLHPSTIELAEKSAEVRQLERTRADLMTILESERRRVDQLLMQSAATGMGDFVKEVKVFTLPVCGYLLTDCYLSPLLVPASLCKAATWIPVQRHSNGVTPIGDHREG